MFVSARFFGNRIVPLSAPRIATQDPFDSEIAALKQTVYLQRF